MPEQGVAIIDRTVHETNRWLNEIQQETGQPDKNLAFQGMRAVLVTLRDNLPVDLAASLSAQLPLLVRGIFYENYVPAETPHTERRTIDWAESVAASGDNLGRDDALGYSRVVLALLRRELDANVVDKITDAIPADVRADLLD